MKESYILDYKSEIYTIKNGLTNTDKYYYQEFMFLSEVNYIKDMEYVSVRNISNTNPLSYTFLVPIVCTKWYSR